MELQRLFSGEIAKGRRNYLDSQKKYELTRTLIYFGISIAVFLLGYISTKTKNNLLTIVAVLGCLPACKSLVGMIMFFRFSSLKGDTADALTGLNLTMPEAYDMVFTTYQKNYVIGHLVVSRGQICGMTSQKDFSEAEFEKHIHQVLNAEGIKNISMKIFTDSSKYLERVQDMQTKHLHNVSDQTDQLVSPEEKDASDLDFKILNILKSVVL